MRKLLVTICVLLGTYVAAELLSLGALAVVREAKPGSIAFSLDEHFSELNDEYLQTYLAGDYHPVLGWDHKPGSEATRGTCLGGSWTESFDTDGARSTPIEFDTALISSYGDSYVKGGELNNDQTWQFQLANQINSGVKNYAAGAFGPYQALLKVRMHIDQSNVYPITILGINEQNIRRAVNLFRPFLYRNVDAKLAFKPGLSCADGECVAVENLLRPDVRSIDEAKEAALKARRLDYWVRRKPVLEYSWLANLLKLARFAETTGFTRDAEPFWNAPDGRAAMHFVVSEFQTAVSRAGSIPVILFVPLRPKEGTTPSYDEFKRQLTDEYPDLIVLDVMDTDFDASLFKLKPTGECHPSEYGHRIIAETVKQGLNDVLTAMGAELSDAGAKKEGDREPNGSAAMQ